VNVTTSDLETRRQPSDLLIEFHPVYVENVKLGFCILNNTNFQWMEGAGPYTLKCWHVAWFFSSLIFTFVKVIQYYYNSKWLGCRDRESFFRSPVTESEVTVWGFFLLYGEKNWCLFVVLSFQCYILKLLELGGSYTWCSPATSDKRKLKPLCISWFAQDQKAGSWQFWAKNPILSFLACVHLSQCCLCSK
jgi:hypothetical protein